MTNDEGMTKHKWELFRSCSCSPVAPERECRQIILTADGIQIRSRSSDLSFNVLAPVNPKSFGSAGRRVMDPTAGIVLVRRNANRLALALRSSVARWLGPCRRSRRESVPD